RRFFLNQFFMDVIKFGGSSVGTAESIESIMSVLKEKNTLGEKPVVVLSAMSGVTNLLAEMAEGAAEGKNFEQGLSDLEQKHFSVAKKLIAVQRQNPVLTQLKIHFNELEELLQSVLNLRELSFQSK